VTGRGRQERPKGLWDLRGADARVLVTGSARLDPLVAPSELPDAIARPLAGRPRELAVLLEHGGFPEPFLRRDPSQSTIKRWLEWLSLVFLVHRVLPYARNVFRSLKKQPKMYLWDWSEVPGGGARLENLVAGHLLKAVHAWTDSGLGTFDLRFVRDKEKREVDFLVLRDRRPWMLLECKASDTEPSPHLVRFARIMAPAIALQLVASSGVHEWFDVAKGLRGHIMSADSFLRLLP